MRRILKWPQEQGLSTCKKSNKSDFIRLLKSDFIRLFKIRSTALVLNHIFSAEEKVWQTLFFDMNLQIQISTSTTTKATSNGVPSQIGEWKVFDSNSEELTEIKALKHSSSNGIKVSSDLNLPLSQKNIAQFYPKFLNKFKISIF